MSEPKQVNDPNLGFRSGVGSVVYHYNFRLVTERHPILGDRASWERAPGVKVGPTQDNCRSQLAVQALLSHYLGADCWHGPSDCTFRCS